MKTVRRIKHGEGKLYRETRLESLRESPAAFSSTYEGALSRDSASWDTQADSSADGGDRATYIIEGNKPLGLAAIYRDDQSSSDGELIQMWVAPELRGDGMAKELLDQLFLWARLNGLSTVRAEVSTSNAKALRFYEKFGFLLSSKCDSTSTVTLTKTVNGVPSL